MSTAPQQGEQQELQDVELRPPLPPQHCTHGSPDDGGVDDDAAATELRSVVVPRGTLCRMFLACQILKVSQETRFTALVLFHRYCYNHRAAANVIMMADDELTETRHHKMVAAACLFLACKAEDELRRVRDIINVAHVLQFENRSKQEPGQQVSCNDLETISVLPDPPLLDESYWQAKEQIVATEQAVLRMLQFDVLVSHPHRIVVLLAEEISSQPELVDVAWRRLNDALFSSSTLMCGALPLACAALGLALEETQDNNDNNETRNNHKQEKAEDLIKTLGLIKHWSQAYGVEQSSLEDAMKRLRQASESLSEL